MFVQQAERGLLLANADELLCSLEHILRTAMGWWWHWKLVLLQSATSMVLASGSVALRDDEVCCAKIEMSG
jgi:hypothetical protein